MNVMPFGIGLGWQRQRHHARNARHVPLISALIALPAAAFAGRPFFTSAWGALKRHSLNMDVLISSASRWRSPCQSWRPRAIAITPISIPL